MTKLKHWWLKLIKEEWELTIFHTGDTKVLPDGSRLETSSPKTYRVKKLTKITPTHFKFTDTQGQKHEIKTVAPVGYNLVKVF